MRPFWNSLIKGFHLMVLWGFKYEFEKMAWHPYYCESRATMCESLLRISIFTFFSVITYETLLCRGLKWKKKQFYLIPFPSFCHSIIFLLFNCEGWWCEWNSYITLLFDHCLSLMKRCKSTFLFSCFC